MDKKKVAQYCCAALVAVGIGLNIQNALSDYGIGENSFSLVAVGGSNSGSNSNSNSNWNSNTNTGPLDESDSDGNGNNENPEKKYYIVEEPCYYTYYGKNGLPVEVCYASYITCHEGGNKEVCAGSYCPVPPEISIGS